MPLVIKFNLGPDLEQLIRDAASEVNNATGKTVVDKRKEKSYVRYGFGSCSGRLLKAVFREQVRTIKLLQVQR